jgi:hypothetical protein
VRVLSLRLQRRALVIFLRRAPIHLIGAAVVLVKTLLVALVQRVVQVALKGSLLAHLVMVLCCGGSNSFGNSNVGARNLAMDLGALPTRPRLGLIDLACPGALGRCWVDHRQLPSLRRARQQVFHVGAAAATPSLRRAR